MSPPAIETDYLVIGAGAAAMAFVDTLLTESDARVVMVDRHERPGGHWNDAYPFVRLHQPSAFYGVNSRPLGSGAIDAVGFNQGLYELASGAEVLAYFDQLMNQRFLPSGRVDYFPMCHCDSGADGAHRFRSLLGGDSRVVRVRRKVVDATHAHTAVPSTHAPKYAVSGGVSCVPLNALPGIRQPYPGYVVVGAGKTGIDACLWLLQNGVDAGRIRWIMPRDAWLLDRSNFQPGMEFFAQSIGGIAGQFEAMASASSLADLFARLEGAGLLLRIDPAVEPTMYRCGTVTQAELHALRAIRDIVRQGRVQVIEATRIVLEHREVPVEPGCLYIDCSANGIPAPPAMPVFDGDRINLLMVRTCQPAFSAALIAYVESRVEGEAEQNALCAVVPSPVVPTDWLRMWSVSMRNQQRWNQHAGLAEWLAHSRLDGTAATVRAVSASDVDKQALLQRYGAAVKRAMATLPNLLAAVG